MVLLFGCNQEELPSDTGLISGKTFDKGLRVEGDIYDGLIIENCTFRNKPLNIGNVKNVLIKNCVFENIKDNGLKIGFIGDASNITVEGCTFKTISYNGIDSHESALNCIIKDCYFEDVALSEIGAAMGQPHHGIYWKGKNVTITNNEFVNGLQPFGNAISIRSSGLISGNTIRESAKNGIMYYADHPGEDSLIIENNFLINNTFFSIAFASPGDASNHNENVVIRFNSMIQTANESIYISEKFESNTNIEIYGNIIVNPNGIYYKLFYPLDKIHTNLESTSDIGFLNIEEGNLHISNASIANGFCSSLTEFPTNDIDGESRMQINLDAGADEIN